MFGESAGGLRRRPEVVVRLKVVVVSLEVVAVGLRSGEGGATSGAGLRKGEEAYLDSQGYRRGRRSRSGPKSVEGAGVPMLFDLGQLENKNQMLDWKRGQEGRVCGIAELRDCDHPVESDAMTAWWRLEMESSAESE